MSTKRMTLALHRRSIRSGLHRHARPLRLALGLAFLAIPLSGCGTASEMWDKITQKDETFVEEPAEKLYNEGLYLD